MKLNWKPIKVKLGQIKAWDNNPRMSNKSQAQRIIASERKFGQPVPFLLQPEIDGCFPLLDGHQRLAAWFTVYGADYEMDAMVSDRPLKEAEHKELVITLHTGATGSWDWNGLSSWSAGDLKEWGMNADALKSWNNDALNLREMMGAEGEPIDYKKEWEGMPEFDDVDTSAIKSVKVNFKTNAAIEAFSKLISQSITDKTISLWYPINERSELLDFQVGNES